MTIPRYLRELPSRETGFFAFVFLSSLINGAILIVILYCTVFIIPVIPYFCQSKKPFIAIFAANRPHAGPTGAQKFAQDVKHGKKCIDESKILLYNIGMTKAEIQQLNKELVSLVKRKPVDYTRIEGILNVFDLMLYSADALKAAVAVWNTDLIRRFIDKGRCSRRGASRRSPTRRKPGAQRLRAHRGRVPRSHRVCAQKSHDAHGQAGGGHRLLRGSVSAVHTLRGGVRRHRKADRVRPGAFRSKRPTA